NFHCLLVAAAVGAGRGAPDCASAIALVSSTPQTTVVPPIVLLSSPPSLPRAARCWRGASPTALLLAPQTAPLRAPRRTPTASPASQRWRSGRRARNSGLRRRPSTRSRRSRAQPATQRRSTGL